MRDILASVFSGIAIWFILSFFFDPTFAQEVVFVHFDEEMDTIGFSNPDNFQWDNGMTTLGAELIDTSTVKLFVTTPIINLWYRVEVFNVFDLAGNIVNPEFDTTSVIWSAVPVELTSFSASIRGNIATLNWSTATEINNFGFEIERNTERIGFVWGSGNSSSPKEYSFVDTLKYGGIYTYRLKQLDTDGSYEYTPEIKIEYHYSGLSTMRLYPNPTSNQFTVELNHISDKHKIQVYSILGELVLEREPDLKVYVTSNLASGFYYVRYMNLVNKLIIVK